jgi:hypothetical protein
MHDRLNAQDDWPLPFWTQESDHFQPERFFWPAVWRVVLGPGSDHLVWLSSPLLTLHHLLGSMQWLLSVLLTRSSLMIVRVVLDHGQQLEKVKE